MDLDATFLPDPDFADAQLAIDVELVDAAPRPDHLDRDVRSGLELRLETEHIAFVRLDAALVLLALQGPGAVGRELDASLETPSFDETPYVGLDFIVRARRAHDLERAVDVREAWRCTITANPEQPKVIGPRRAVEMHVVVFAR